MSSNMFERETAQLLCWRTVERRSGPGIPLGHLDVAVPPAAPRNGAAKMHSAHTSAM